MFLYKSLVLLCSAVSKDQSQHDGEGGGLCQGQAVWWELGEHSQGGAVPAPWSLSPLP